MFYIYIALYIINSYTNPYIVYMNYMYYIEIYI